MTNLSRWASIFNPKTQVLFQLESFNDVTGLYQCKERIGNGVPCYNWTSPVYHVWGTRQVGTNDYELS